MPKKRVKHPKVATSVSVRGPDRKRYDRATKKLGLESFNAFVEVALNKLTEETLQESPPRETSSVESQLDAMRKDIRLLTAELSKLQKALAERTLVES